jgi:hypothetical protein
MDFLVVDDRGAAGFSWLAVEPITRTSHALAADGRVWLVDPVRWPEATERARALGEPAAVLQLLDRHNRDCAAIAADLRIPHLVVPRELPDTPFAVVDLVRRRHWNESALWWERDRTLVVSEAIGGSPFFAVGSDRLGVHGLLKVVPPRRQLGALEPSHVLVGHGVGVHGPEATHDLRRALGRSRLHVLSWLATLPFANRRASRFLRELESGAG